LSEHTATSHSQTLLPPHAIHPQALAVDMGERYDASTDGGADAAAAGGPESTFYEITIATVDQPKLLSRLSDAMVRWWQSLWGGWDWGCGPVPAGVLCISKSSPAEPQLCILYNPTCHSLTRPPPPPG